ncbi:hypothetical protein CPC08DRAFT_793474 [Agrocybe pediades]|nr:hypothetical protein CPC08DRAFT_793474 [Agrocybe pediades]
MTLLTKGDRSVVSHWLYSSPLILQMSTTESLKPVYAFVDDTDGDIEYAGAQKDWSLARNLQPANVKPAWYDTLHSVTAADGTLFVLYDFEGTFISAHFYVPDTYGLEEFATNFISNCTLDGNLLKPVFDPYIRPESDVALGGSYTYLPDQESTLGAGSHRFQAFGNFSLSLAFDGLFYVPMDLEAARNVSDLVYPIQRNLTMAGDIFEFPYIGNQIALYSIWGVGGIDRPINFSYSIDGGPAINWTTEALTRNDSTITDYLLLQTHYNHSSPSLGSHNLQLELKTDNVLVPLQYAIVQNSMSTIGVNLTASPPTPVTSPFPELSERTHPVVPDIAIAISVAVFFVLIVAALIKHLWLKWARSKRETAPNASGMVVPFLHRPAIMRLAFDAVDSKNRRHRQIANGEGRTVTRKQARGVELPTQAQMTVASLEDRARAPVAPRPPPSPSPLRMEQPSVVPPDPGHPITHTGAQPAYRMHEDAGSVPITTPVPEDEVIDLPPNYSSILGRP